MTLFDFTIKAAKKYSGNPTQHNHGQLLMAYDDLDLEDQLAADLIIREYIFAWGFEIHDS